MEHGFCHMFPGALASQMFVCRGLVSAEQFLHNGKPGINLPEFGYPCNGNAKRDEALRQFRRRPTP
jgi:hypothetical protein